MKIVVLLSAGRHPLSARPAPVPVEMQAIRLAAELGPPPAGLHVGDDVSAVADALGHGLGRLVILQAGDPAEGDPLPALRDHLVAMPPDLILAGRRGRGGTDSGLLPYRLAQALGWPIIADVVSLEPAQSAIQAGQALPRGARRRLLVPLPCVATIHPAAPPARPFRHAGLRGEVVRHASPPLPPGPPLSPGPAGDLRPYRARPQMIERSETGGRALQGLSAEQAARDILAELRRRNLIKGE
jgi:electron transfer flavoprotein beta subunit